MYFRRFAGRFIAVILMYFALPICTASNGLVVEPAIQRGPEGNDFTFECVGERPLNWYKVLSDGTEMEVHNNHRFDIIYHYVPERHHYMGRMTVRQATVAESGNYVCKLKGAGLRYSAELWVFTVAAYRNELPTRADHQASVEIDPSMPELTLDKDLVLSCTFENATAGSLVWSVKKGETRESLPAGNEDSHIQVLDNGTLIIRKMTDEDAGIYACTHLGDEGNQTAEVNLGGHIKLTAPQSVKFTEGTDARIKCEARVSAAVFLPDIEWQVDGEDVGSACANRCSTTEERTDDAITSWLKVAEITKEDRKNYSCIASNDASREREDILLRVRDRLAALWPFLGILLEVLIIVLVLVVHEKCKGGNDFGEEDEEDLKKEVKPNMGDSDLRMRTTKQ
ncbi:neuroplastin-like [Diadema antillarum]|uniref:neuroplastin-like n=1 Tax=Diadema antillarum TaxID=105358 RepID=UPI003A89114E